MKIKVCPICGKEFEADGKQKYCSIECAAANLSHIRNEWHNARNEATRAKVYQEICLELAKCHTVFEQAERLKEYCILRKDAYNLIKGE